MNLKNEFDAPVPTIVLAEGEFGKTGGKTANGVVLHSEVFDAKVVVDTETAGQMPSAVLDNPSAPSIPIVESVEQALEDAPDASALVIGAATAGGFLPESWIEDIENAIRAGCDIVSGLHIFLSEDEQWREIAEQYDVRIFDVRKPPEGDALRVGNGSVDEIDADIVLIMGTDCAVGKRTTTYELFQASVEANLNVGWVATGQTGIMVGANEGVVVDRVPSDFTAGVVEDMVKSVGESHAIVFVEGQASLTHRAYSGVTLSILHGSWPDAVVLADDPNRDRRTHFESFSVDGVAKERRLIEDLSSAPVVAISTWGDSDWAEDGYDIPAANVYEEGGSNELLSAILDELDNNPTK